MKTLLFLRSVFRFAALVCAVFGSTSSVAHAAKAAAAAPMPTIYAFNVSGSTTMNLGESKTFNWSVGDATTITFTPGVGVVTGTSVSVTPTTTTTYVLTAANKTGSVSQAKLITVVVPPTIQSLTASPNSISAGSSSTLAWSAPGASWFDVTADNDASPGHIFANSTVVKPKVTTTYTVIAHNAAGVSTPKTVLVTVAAVVAKPTITSLSASPASIVQGASATLNWAVTGATTLSIAPTIGTVTGSSVTVAPTATTTYTLTATNSAGSTTKKVTVTVTPPIAVPVISTLTATPTVIAPGASSTLAWSVSGASSLALSANVGTSPGTVTGSSLSVSPSATTTYTLTASNSSGSVTRTVTVSVSGVAAPVISSFIATPAQIQAGSSSTLSWSVTGATSLALSSDVGASPGQVTGTSVTVSPTVSTTYTLTATNAGGSRTAVIPVIIFTPGNGSVVHPRIWVTPDTVTALNQRASANNAAWIKLRNECDLFVNMAISFPDQDPSSNTINGGYQYNDYLVPSEELALGYLAAKTADPVRAARYAAKERQLLLALSDPVHHGRPTTDSGYSIRSYVPALALGYDWIYETLSSADRVQIYTEINRWVASFDQTGFGRNYPQGNYFAGYYCAKALAALATEGDNANADTMWNDWLNRLHYGMVQPYHQQWLSGGGAPDGWNYGPFETINMLRPLAAALTAKGLDLIHSAKPMAYFDGHARWMTQFTWPNLKTVSDRGFVYEGDNPTSTDSNWSTQYNGLLHLANGDNAPLMQRYTLDIRATQGVNLVDPWVEFLFQNPTAPTADYRVPLSYHTSGDGQVAMRSGWDANAVWGSFQSGPLTNFPDSAEELYDQGSLAIQRGNVQFVVNPWAALMRNTPGTDDSNGVFDNVYSEIFGDQTDGVHAGRRIFNTYYAARSGGYWGQIGNGPGSSTTLSRFEDGGSYVLTRGTHLEDQYLAPHPISGWTRTIVYVRPQLFIAYDHTTLNNAAVDNWMAWHVAAAPTEQPGAAGTHRFDILDTRAAFGGNLFRGRVTTVLPSGHTVTPVNLFNRSKVYRLEVRNGSPAPATNWLTVFDASASAASAGSAAPLNAASGNVIAGPVEGTLITTAGSNLVVLFSQTGTTVFGAITIAVPAMNTYCLVTDLAPNQGYTVTSTVANGTLTLQFTSGGALTTSAQGSLAINVSAAGVITTP